jgi:NhaP-type Na+/H+ or K+/H+ antiporter
MRDLEKYHVREIFLLILFAYASYITSETLGFSGVITLFCCGCYLGQFLFNEPFYWSSDLKVQSRKRTLRKRLYAY